MFGAPVSGPVEDVTPTFLTRGVLEVLRECDHLANKILTSHGNAALYFLQFQLGRPGPLAMLCIQ